MSGDARTSLRAVIGRERGSRKGLASGRQTDHGRASELARPTRTDLPIEAELLALDLAAGYGGADVLTDVTFGVAQGEALAILGVNGSGKTTLTKVICGLHPARRGSIQFQGSDITSLPPYERTRLGIGLLPEGRGIFPQLTVQENLEAAVVSLFGRKRARTRIDAMTSRHPILGERRHQRAGTLSGGQQQLLAVARVLAAEPRIIIADELSLGLAPPVAASLYESLAEANRAGITVLLIEQQIKVALSMTSRALIFQHGAIAWTGKSEAVSGAVLSKFLGESTADQAESRASHNEST
jgi:branched-chain amino acid transport system ATP-binding protein